jgi:hypothetical protein
LRLGEDEHRNRGRCRRMGTFQERRKGKSVWKREGLLGSGGEGVQ